MYRFFGGFLTGVVCLAFMCGPSPAADPVKIEFVKTQLDPIFRSEGVAVGDYNKDGKADIAAGYVWYEAPNWTMHSIIEQAPQYDPKGYSNSFCTFADDLNHDGWMDIIIVDFPGTPTWWFENPKQPNMLWPKHECTPVTNNESPQYLDLDGDGRRELLAAVAPDTASSDGPDRQMAIIRPAEDPAAAWTINPISAKAAPGTQKYSHGLGAGDVNKDGRQDVLCADGWWEGPEAASDAPWKFHPAPWGGQASDIRVYDFDGDDDNDVLTSSPHGFGLWWHEQVAANQWKMHEIDKTFSQLHSVWLADFNGDGLMDIVTGKRWWAHASGDPGVDEPAVMNWFELQREGNKPVWTKRQFDHESGVGTQFEVADVNADGLLDVVCSNKKGVHLFTQSRDSQ